MTLTDYRLNENNCFVAMQYYRLIVNRTYIVVLTKSSLLGIVANGVVSAKGPDAMANYMLRNLIVEGDLNDPSSYVKSKHSDKVRNLHLESDEILMQNRANFRLKYQDIKEVRYDPTKKWGMGYYPHDGKVYVDTAEGKTLEFIILGNQNGEAIQKNILSRKR
jgi:hypothetical protein